MYRAPAYAQDRLTQNRRRYDRIVDVVRHRAARGDVEAVLRSAHLAANYAWAAPNGLLADPDLERLVVAAVRDGRGGPRVDGGRTSGRVLHVLSEAFEHGGHTRLARRWISRDPRAGSVVLTNQLSDVPPSVRATTESAGGRVHDLRAGSRTLHGRAVQLRRLMDDADVVVVHAHPYEAVVLAAANLPGARPPVLHMNHADHTFWLGLGGADVVVDFRSAGRTLTERLRRVRGERTGMLPLPVDAPPAADRGQIRRDLRLGTDDVLALVVADELKLRPSWGRGFADLLRDVLSAHSRLRVAVVGMTPTGPWAPIAQRFGPRVVFPGHVPDAGRWYTAADIYLNSYPVVAGTSSLEAAAAGLPILTLRDLDAPHGYGAVYQGPSPGLASVEHVATGGDQYQSRLRRLIRDATQRTASGAATREAVLSVHDGAGWGASLEALYERARGTDAVSLDEYPDRVLDEDYGPLLLAFSLPGNHTPDVGHVPHSLGDQMDDSLSYDVFAASSRDLGPSLSVRAAGGWETHPEWTRRLLALARLHPRLSVSLPFVADDDAAGSRSVALVTALLAQDGSSPDDCGEVSLDAQAPAAREPAVAGELAATAEVLDRLEAVLSSPCWTAPPATTDGPARRPVAVG